MVVKSFAPNGWGLWQMHGNVWERVQDHWHDNYDNAPGNGAVWAAGDGAACVVRGGSWYDGARDLRSACRYHVELVNSDYFLGFRCARVQGEVAESIDSVQQRSGTRSAALDCSDGVGE